MSSSPTTTKQFFLRVLVGIGMSCFLTTAARVEVIIFSYDRPLQLYALLESFHRHVSGFSHISVIVRSSNALFIHAYEQVQQAFKKVQFIQQSLRPRADFKSILMRCLTKSTAQHIIFAVDDMVVTDAVDLAYCAQLLEKTGAHGFYLRMGKNITYSYARNRLLRLPPYTPVGDTILSWRFADAAGGYWNYPQTVDMTVYRARDLRIQLQRIPFTSPNTLESRWRKTYEKAAMQQQGLCFMHSKVVNIPLNLVQQDWHNKNLNTYSVEQLLQKFTDGFKMNINVLYQLNNRSAHEACEITFIPR